MDRINTTGILLPITAIVSMVLTGIEMEQTNG